MYKLNICRTQIVCHPYYILLPFSYSCVFAGRILSQLLVTVTCWFILVTCGICPRNILIQVREHTQSTSLHQKTHQAKTQYIDIKPRRKQKHVHTYCGWRKYCTSWLVVYPIIYRGSTIKGGAGFLPSTVSGENNTELMVTQRKSKPYPNTPSHPSSPPGISGSISESRRNLPTVMMKNIN